MIDDGVTAVQAFEAGEVDVTNASGVSRPRRSRGSRRPPSTRSTRGSATYYYGFNVENIPDVNQRRAMALAIDRARSSTRSRRPTSCRRPASRPRACRGSTRSTRPRMAAGDGDIEQAKSLMDQVAEPEEERQPAAQRLAGSPRDRGRGPGGMEGTRPQVDDPAPGVGAVPRVHRPAAGQVGGRLPARLDRRLRRRHQLPRALDVRLGEQQHELLQPGVRPAHRAGARDAGQRRRATTSTRSSSRCCFGEDGDVPIAPIYWYTYVQQERVGQGHARAEPARPDRPHVSGGGEE